MSRYEKYSEVAQHYDRTRVPIGAEILIGALALVGQSRSESRLLDAGCGTGAYTELALPYVDHIDAMDINPGMLAVARGKLADAASETRVTFHQGSVLDMPFEAACFDVVTFHQVLHHLESGQDGSFDGHRIALVEARRVLRPGGFLIVNCTSHDQLRHGYWYMHLIPTALRSLYDRCIPTEKLMAMLSEVGFTFEGRFVPLDGALQGAAYFEAEGPLEPTWRRAESSWTLAPEEEIAAAEAKLRELRENDGLDAYLAEHDANRHRVGQTTFVLARKA
ncbi:MAG: class I SAM-dependent methyltransferase [Alphaproteobacteria bacterium]|nr:class I SAM-dependent methyltransferase [Alphaproteobacteria bacterium]